MAYPNLRQAIWLLALLTLIDVGMGMLISVVESISGEPFGDSNYVMGLAAIVTFLLILSFVSHRTGRRWVSLFRPAKSHFDWRVWPCVAISIPGIVVVIHELNNALIFVFPIPESIQEIFQSPIRNGTSYRSDVFRGAVVAPFVEELLFRGIILSGLLSNCTRNYAIIWSSILFGVSHLDPWQLPGTFAGGLVLAWWVIRTGSLLPALFGHTLYNFIFTTMMHFDIPHFAVSDDPNVIVFNPWWWSTGGAVLAALGLWWFHLISKRTRHNALGGLLPSDVQRKPV